MPWNSALVAIVLLSAIGVAGVITFVWYAARGNKTNLALLSEILSDQSLRKALQDDGEAGKRLIQLIENQVTEEMRHRQKKTTLDNILSKIDWDVPGLIGVGVTLAIIVMMASQQTTAIPEEFIAGWLTIIGFYFGRNTSRIRNADLAERQRPTNKEVD